MSDAFLDSLPSYERSKWERLKLRSPEEYERLREKVKENGPKSIEKELARNAEFAEFSFALETEPHLKDQLKEKLQDSLRDLGAEKIVDGKVDQAFKSAIESGNFDVVVDAHDRSPKLKVKPNTSNEKGSGIDAPSGKVAEALPLKLAIQDKLLLSFKIHSKQK